MTRPNPKEVPLLLTLLLVPLNSLKAILVDENLETTAYMLEIIIFVLKYFRNIAYVELSTSLKTLL